MLPILKAWAVEAGTEMSLAWSLRAFGRVERLLLCFRPRPNNPRFRGGRTYAKRSLFLILHHARAAPIVWL